MRLRSTFCKERALEDRMGKTQVSGKFGRLKLIVDGYVAHRCHHVTVLALEGACQSGQEDEGRRSHH